MAEIKALSSGPLEGLYLDEKETDFLTNEYRSVFMTEFLIGRNKVQLYGYPLIMAERSELIKTSLSKFAFSKPPYELLTFGIVFERPITSLWLYLNTGNTKIAGDLAELLQLYRLADYFGIEKIGGFSYYGKLSRMITEKFATISDEDVPTISQEINQDTLVKVLNEEYKNDNFNTVAQKTFNESGLGTYHGNEYEYRFLPKIHEQSLMVAREKFPEIAKRLNYVPVFYNGMYYTMVDRKTLSDRKILDEKMKRAHWVPTDKGYNHGYTTFGENENIHQIIFNPDSIELTGRGLITKIMKIGGKDVMRLANPVM